MNKIQMHKDLCIKLHNTYKHKNQDYGDSFGRSVAKRGIAAAMTRMEDKWNRLDNLTLNPDNIKVKDETIGDTLIDLANYALMTYMELELANSSKKEESPKPEKKRKKSTKKTHGIEIRTVPTKYNKEPATDTKVMNNED